MRSKVIMNILYSVYIPEKKKGGGGKGGRGKVFFNLRGNEFICSLIPIKQQVLND